MLAVNELNSKRDGRLTFSRFSVDRGNSELLMKRKGLPALRKHLVTAPTMGAIWRIRWNKNHLGGFSRWI